MLPFLYHFAVQDLKNRLFLQYLFTVYSWAVNCVASYKVSHTWLALR